MANRKKKRKKKERKKERKREREREREQTESKNIQKLSGREGISRHFQRGFIFFTIVVDVVGPSLLFLRW